MNNLQYSNERTIRIKDLIITICQRWRSLIVCLVIGAVVLGALGWLKSVDDVIYTQEQAEAIALSLGSKRAGVIESFAEDIKDSTDQIIRQGIYNKDALIMKFIWASTQTLILLVKASLSSILNIREKSIGKPSIGFITMREFGILSATLSPRCIPL